MIKIIKKEIEDLLDFVPYLWYLVRKIIYDRRLAPYLGPVISLMIFLTMGILSIRILYSISKLLLGNDAMVWTEKTIILANTIPFKPYILVGLIILYFIVFENHLLRYPRANKKKITIGLAFNFNFIKRKDLGEILSHARDIKEELYRTIRKEDLGRQYKIIIINDYLADKIFRNISNKEFRSKFIKKTKLAFIIFGYVKRYPYNKKEQYKFELDYMVTHRPIPENVSTQMGTNFGRILKEQTWNYEVDDSGNLITEVASNIRHNVFYALGIVASLYVNGHEISKKLLLKLLEDIKDCNNRSAFFKKSIKYNLSASHYFHAVSLFNNKTTNDYLQKSIENLNTSVKFRPTYNAYLLIGYFLFLSSDIDSAFKAIIESSKYSTDTSWRFSEAFLYFYKGDKDSIKKGMQIYKSISQKSITKIKLQSFDFILATINDVIAKENKYQFLYSKIYVLSKCLKDKNSATNTFNELVEKIRAEDENYFLVLEAKNILN